MVISVKTVVKALSKGTVLRTGIHLLTCKHDINRIFCASCDNGCFCKAGLFSNKKGNDFAVQSSLDFSYLSFVFIINKSYLSINKVFVCLLRNAKIVYKIKSGKVAG